MSNSPATMLYHEDNDTVEIWWCSRYALSDGFGSIYQSITTVEKAKQGVFGTPKRIGIGTSGRDFGYPAVVKTPDNQVFFMYYNGSSNSTKMMMMYGIYDRINVAKSNQKIISPEGVEHFKYSTNANGLLKMESIEYIRHKGASVSDKFPISHSFYLKTPISILETVPTDNNINVINMPSKLGSQYNDYIGAYILEVIVEFASTIEQQLSFYANTSIPLARIIRRNPTADARKENVFLTAPCAIVDAIECNKGQIRMKVSDFTKINSLTVICYGYVAMN